MDLVMYSVGTVEVELDVSSSLPWFGITADFQNAPLWIVLLLIFPLAATLTAFLMWIILSLNGTSHIHFEHPSIPLPPPFPVSNCPSRHNFLSGA